MALERIINEAGLRWDGQNSGVLCLYAMVNFKYVVPMEAHGTNA